MFTVRMFLTAPELSPCRLQLPSGPTDPPSLFSFYGLHCRAASAPVPRISSAPFLLFLPSSSFSLSSSSCCFSSSCSSSLYSSHPGVHGSVSLTFASALPTAGQCFVFFCSSFTMVSLRRCHFGCQVQLCPVTMLPELAGTGFVQYRAAPAFPQKPLETHQGKHLGTYIWSSCIEMHVFLHLSISWSRGNRKPV